MQPALSELEKLPAYRERREHVFPSRHSLEWFLRLHRQGLVESGALLKVQGQWFAVPDRFDAYVIADGAKAAQRRIGTGQ
ncbi:MAG: hypothetical protein IBJ14_11725 [Hydrogenophaga sp.]|nr:hypothetical protein [Hydrogenophaga sp.]